MLNGTSWHTVLPISLSAGNSSLPLKGSLVLDFDYGNLPSNTDTDWTRPALSARIAYQMGEVKTARHIVENILSEIDLWLPTPLKLFAVMLYKARLAFYNGNLEAAESCYRWAFDVMKEYQLDTACGSGAADLYDEWGECQMMLGATEAAMALYQLAVATDLACHEADPCQMSPWRLARLADLFAVQGALTSSKLCLELAEAMADSPVEKEFVRTYCVAA
jgi:tetratricopeptide (TPR) repeat protein